MRSGWAKCVVILAGLASPVLCRAQEENPPASGATAPSGFRAFMVADDRYDPKKTPPVRPDDRDPRDRTRMMHDLVVERGLNPTLAVFSRAIPKDDAPLAGLIKQLDPLVAKHKASSFGSFVVFLSLEKEFPQDESRDDAGQYLREARSQEVRALADAMKAKRVPLALAATRSPQTAAWGVGNNDAVVVLYNRMRVIKSWAAPNGMSLTDEQIKEILATADKEAATGK